MEKDAIQTLRGFVDIEYLDDDGNVVGEPEILGENLILNNMRISLPLMILPHVVTGRVDNAEGGSTWRPYKVCMIGFGLGDAAVVNPTVVPQHPEDGRTRLTLDDTAFPLSFAGLQSPIKRIPPISGGPCDTVVDPDTETLRAEYDGNSKLAAISMLKEVDPDGVQVQLPVPGAGAEVVLSFTIGKNEYIGSILEMGLFVSTGTPDSPEPITITGSTISGRLFGGSTPLIVARKTRSRILEKTDKFRFRVNWRIRS